MINLIVNRMKTNVCFKTLILTSVMILSGIMSYASNKDNLFSKSKIVGGMLISKTIYAQNGNTLKNYMKYEYIYDSQDRVVEYDCFKWDSFSESWLNDICVKYTYKNNTTTANYYKWDSESLKYILIPDLTITISDDLK